MQNETQALLHLLQFFLDSSILGLEKQNIGTQESEKEQPEQIGRLWLFQNLDNTLASKVSVHEKDKTDQRREPNRSVGSHALEKKHLLDMVHQKENVKVQSFARRLLVGGNVHAPKLGIRNRKNDTNQGHGNVEHRDDQGDVVGTSGFVESIKEPFAQRSHPNERSVTERRLDGRIVVKLQHHRDHS